MRQAQWRASCFNLAYRSAKKEALLDSLVRMATARGYLLQIDDGWRSFDLKITLSIWGHAVILTANARDQNERDLLLIRCTLLFSRWIWLLLSGDAALIALTIFTRPSQASLSAAFGLFGLGIATRQMLAFTHAVQTMIDLAARQSALTDHNGVQKDGNRLYLPCVT
jgi:hypothetical protein